MTNADIGYGAKFGIGDGADPEVFTDIAEVTAVTPPGLNKEFQDATHLQSPDQYREHIQSLIDTGDVTLTFNFVPSATDTVFAAFHADPGNKQITFPNGVKLRFYGTFASYEQPELTPEGIMQATATVKRLSGKPTLHAAE